jgi:6,7-dimethyl-8-ribityllumazine synthase
MIRLGIVTTEYHRELTSRMVDAAKKHANALGADVKETVWVPGSYEMPLAVQRLIKKKGIDAVITLGYIEKGSTMHGEMIGKAVAPKLLDLSLKYDKPVGLGIIGPGATYEQAEERVEKQAKEAVDAAIKML